jgi:hypothetical protein
MTRKGTVITAANIRMVQRGTLQPAEQKNVAQIMSIQMFRLSRIVQCQEAVM